MTRPRLALLPSLLLLLSPIAVSPLSAAALTIEGTRQPARSRLGLGGFHTCALKTDGRVWCWGRNNYGQVGDGTQFDRLTPVQVSSAVNVIALAGGNNHTCLLTSDGNVACWGRNQHGQLGDASNNDRYTPTLVPNLTGVVRIAAGEAHTCAALVTGEVRCWGRNQLGQLGNNSAAGTSSNTPVTVVRTNAGTPLGGVIDLALGTHHSCALRFNGVVWCWGDNADGQAARPAGANLSLAGQVSGLTGEAILLTAGARHTCAGMSTRQLYCWGYNSAGQLGDGTLYNRTTPVLAQTGGADIVGISAGLEHTCILRAETVTYCWGANLHGELGDNTGVSRVSLGLPAGSAFVLGLASSQNRHSCAVKPDEIKCWGQNASGQIGDGTLWDQLLPARVLDDNGDRARLLAVGSDHNCAVRGSGSVGCWGNNSTGELGDSTYTSRTTPDPLLGIGSNEDLLVAADDSYSCVLYFANAFCTGFNLYGQHGNGSNVSTTRIGAAVGPAAGPYPVKFEGIGIAEHHGCGVQAGGAVKCWGRNLYGQLGDNSVIDRWEPVTASGIAGAVMVTAGRGHSCALLANGSVKCWGLNTSGQLGDGTFTNRLTPVAVTGLTDAVSISAGGLHTCAVRSGGTLVCWGDNVEGQIGNGLTANRNTFAAAMGITTAVAAVGSAEGTCALLADGTAKCWGDNYYGQIGDNTYSDRLTPTVVVDPVLQPNGLIGIASLAGTSSAVLNISNCAVKADGRPYCWGSNAAGKLGDGTTTNRPLPTAVLTF